MADSITVNINGLSDLVIKLRRFPAALQKKGLTKAMRKGATVVRKAAIAGAQRVDRTQTPEKIFKNIVVQTATRLGKRNHGVAMRVGVLGGARSTSRDAVRARRRRARSGIKSLDELGEIAGAGKNNPGGDTWYWRFLEFGTSRFAAKAFMLPALEQNTERTIDVITEALKKEIDQLAAKGVTL